MKLHSKFVKVLIMSLLFIMMLVACSPAGTSSTVEPGIDSEVDLTGTSWMLESFELANKLTAVLPNTSILLQFNEDGINGSAGCNNYFADSTVSGSSLTFGPIGSTKMACPESIMQQEVQFLTALGSVSRHALAGEQLTLQYEDGTLIFVPTVDESTDEADTAVETKTLFVGPELVDCVGVAPQKCMQVRESEADDWAFFYDQIVGFEYEPGFEYELLVSETGIENPPADGSSIELTLVEVVSKTAVSLTETPHQQDNEMPGSSWTLIEFGSNDSLTPVLPDSEITLNFNADEINGSAGCNSYFVEATTEGNMLSFGLIGSTLMACSEELMQQETDFLAALAQVTSYVLEGNRLTLQYDDGILIFEADEIVEADEEIVPWETAVAFLESGDVVEIFQTHSLDVTLTLQDGRIIKTVEPAIDNIFHAIEDCGEPCSNILMATE